MRKTIFLMLILSGCASAKVVESESGEHTLRVSTTGAISSPALVEEAMHREAARLCSAGWERVSERVEPRQTQSPLLSPTAAVVWRIRCL